MHAPAHMIACPQDPLQTDTTQACSSSPTWSPPQVLGFPALSTTAAAPQTWLDNSSDDQGSATNDGEAHDDGDAPKHRSAKHSMLAQLSPNGASYGGRTAVQVKPKRFHAVFTPMVTGNEELGAGVESRANGEYLGADGAPHE
ncbi:hypothetical protein V6N13_093421 [Hibiscus sabdariffa]